MFVGFGVDSPLIIRTALVRAKKVGFTEVVSESLFILLWDTTGAR